MIFKKIFATQGNHVFANGTKAIFNADGLYETNKPKEIAELQAEPELYEEVPAEKAPEKVAAPEATHAKLAKAITGLKTSDKM